MAGTLCVTLLLLLSTIAVGGRKTWRRRSQQIVPSSWERSEGGGESFPLDFTAVEGNMDNFMNQIKSLAQSLYPCSAQRLDDEMKLHSLHNKSVTCNDGSPAGYYLKESKGSRRWLVFLEGGWYCISRENCDIRYDTMRSLMSSRAWPPSKTASGILSTQPEENPHWWNANIVFIPYCSSDVWSGVSPKTEKSGYAFMGSLIIQEVVKELLGKGLDTAKLLLLAGSRYWNSMVPERCKQQFKEGEEWNCFFGYKIYPTLRSPVFVVQWLFDEAQLTVDNVHLSRQPVQESQWLYIQNLGRELRNTLKDVGASFAPACLAHEVITRSHWTEIQVRGTSLPRALHCWDRSLQEPNKNSKVQLKGCPFHLMDSCPWPQCNPTCPSIRDHFTGQEMSVVQFLMHLGFDVQKMASQQGMEPGKLLGVLSS